MNSLYDELSEKLKEREGPRRGAGPRADIGILLFANRDALSDLWIAADRCGRAASEDALSVLREIVDKLRPLFGERASR